MWPRLSRTLAKAVLSCSGTPSAMLSRAWWRRTSRPEEERLDTLRHAFFAPGHDARPWRSGWYPATLQIERAAARTVPAATYRACGRAAILEIFGALDSFKPRSSWPELRDQRGDKVTATVIEDASHALFPEQPDTVSQAILAFLARHSR